MVVPTSLSAVVLGAAVALTLTACSGADDPAPVSAPPAVDTSATASASPVASPAGPESDDPRGAIA